MESEPERILVVIVWMAPDQRGRFEPHQYAGDTGYSADPREAFHDGGARFLKLQATMASRNAPKNTNSQPTILRRVVSLRSRHSDPVFTNPSDGLKSLLLAGVQTLWEWREIGRVRQPSVLEMMFSYTTSAFTSLDILTSIRVPS